MPWVTKSPGNVLVSSFPVLGLWFRMTWRPRNPHFPKHPRWFPCRVPSASSEKAELVDMKAVTSSSPASSHKDPWARWGWGKKGGQASCLLGPTQDEKHSEGGKAGGSPIWRTEQLYSVPTSPRTGWSLPLLLPLPLLSLYLLLFPQSVPWGWWS